MRQYLVCGALYHNVSHLECGCRVGRMIRVCESVQVDGVRAEIGCLLMRREGSLPYECSRLNVSPEYALLFKEASLPSD